MSHRICLTTDWKLAEFPTDDRAVWVHHKTDCPDVSKRVLAEEFVKQPKAYMRGSEFVVLLNLVSKIIRPGSRLKYGQFLTDPWNELPRLSVDTHLYIEQPWRMWFHFGAVDAPFGAPEEKYHTSYRVESDWRKYIETDEGNPCKIDRVSKYGKGVAVFRGGFRFDDVNISVESMSEAAHQRYAIEKEAAFNEERTPSAIIKRLGNFAKSEWPLRCNPRSLFGSRQLLVRLTDFGVDRYLARRIQEEVDLTNSIGEVLSG